MIISCLESMAEISSFCVRLRYEWEDLIGFCNQWLDELIGSPRFSQCLTALLYCCDG